MTTLFYILAYLAVIGFVATAAIKVKGYLAASPLHARWELYPVPHEGPKGAYGGSFMEETDCSSCTPPSPTTSSCGSAPIPSTWVCIC